MLLHPAGSITLDSWSPSPSGALIAVQLSAGGPEDSELVVLETGRTVDGRLYLFTDLDAPRFRLAVTDPGSPRSAELDDAARAGSVGRDWGPHRPVAWVEAGGAYAWPIFRGGSEEGAAWHEAGYRADKQNVFDDLHAAAQHLIDSGWTSPDRLGIQADPTQARWWALR